MIPVGIGYIIAAAVFLCNPVINIVDILPDFIGYLLLIRGLRQLSYISEPAREAKLYASRLMWVTLIKFLISVAIEIWSSSVLSQPTMRLTYALVFSAWELVLFIPMLNRLLESVSMLGLMHDSRAAIFGSDQLRILGIVFYSVRVACCMLPEFVYLQSAEELYTVYADNRIVLDYSTYRPYLVVLFGAIALVWGIAWCISLCKYLRRVKKDPVFSDAVCRRLQENSRWIQKDLLSHVWKRSFILFFAACLFLCGIEWEYVNILPAFAGCLLIAAGFMQMRGLYHFPRVTGTVIVAAALPTAAYFGYSLHMRSLWLGIYHYKWGADIPLSEQSARAQAEPQQMMFFWATLACSVLLFAVFLLFYRSILKVYRENGRTGIHDEDFIDQKLRKRQERENIRAGLLLPLWYALVLITATAAELPDVSFYNTPIPFANQILKVIFLISAGRFLRNLYADLSDSVQERPDFEAKLAKLDVKKI